MLQLKPENTLHSNPSLGPICRAAAVQRYVSLPGAVWHGTRRCCSAMPCRTWPSCSDGQPVLTVTCGTLLQALLLLAGLLLLLPEAKASFVQSPL